MTDQQNAISESSLSISTIAEEAVRLMRDHRSDLWSAPVLMFKTFHDIPPLVKDSMKYVDFCVSDKDLNMPLREFSDRFIRPAVACLSGSIPSNARFCKLVGTPNKIVRSLDDITISISCAKNIENDRALVMRIEAIVSPEKVSANA